MRPLTVKHRPASLPRPPGDAVTSGRWLIYGGQAAFLLFLILAWEGLALWLGDFVIASPGATLGALGDGWRQGWFAGDLQITLLETGLGYLLAAVSGVWAGFWLGTHRFWGDVMEPVVLGVYSIPKVTLYPVFLFAFGLGISSKVGFGMFHGVFPIIVFTLSGVRQVRPVLLKAGRSLRLTGAQTFRLIVLPSVLPSLATGLRFGFSTTFLGTILGEMFAARHGLGFQLIQATTLHQVPKMFSIILVLVALALVVNGAFMTWERSLSRQSGS